MRLGFRSTTTIAALSVLLPAVTIATTAGAPSVSASASPPAVTTAAPPPKPHPDPPHRQCFRWGQHQRCGWY